MTATTLPTNWPGAIARKPQSEAARLSTTAYLLVDGFSMMAFVAATEPLRIANRIAGETLYRWQLVSESGAEVTASNGMRVLVDARLDEITGSVRLAVCSGFLDGSSPSRAVLTRLRALDGAGAVLGGIDTGCFALAEAGLLDGQTVTLHWESLPAFRECYPLVHAVESLYEIGSRRFSCAGGMAATDMALAELAREHEPDLADAVAEQLIHDRARDPASRQRLSIVKRLGIHNAALVRAIALMETHLEPPLSLAVLAERVARSPRQLQRLFETELHTTPQAWYRDLRLDHARSLVEATDRPLAEIALAAGFSSATAFSRAFRNRFGQAPSGLRRH
ncbi:GlxA family transcriptional regulator [Salinisphaera hydrothermalis]|uniref:GlxA family transcriptional regulator n=1 Tax=Salinisphaera hydrothermalis TaxID=563188 RepID=UPI003342280E